MFLDDELYQIGLSKGTRPTHWKDKSIVISELLEAINKYLNNQATAKKIISNTNLELAIKRSKLHWINAINKLHKQGCIFINPNGLICEVEYNNDKADVLIDYNKDAT